MPDKRPVEMPDLKGGRKQNTSRVTKRIENKGFDKQRTSEQLLKKDEAPVTDDARAPVTAIKNLPVFKNQQPLSLSRRETEIRKHDKYRKRLEVTNRQLVDEYYRLLQDVK